MSIKAEYREALLHSLEHFMVHIQLEGDYYLDTKLKVVRKTILEIKSDLEIDINWLHSNSRILLEAIPVYRAFLKRRIAEATPGDEDVDFWRKDNLLLAHIESNLNEFVDSVMNK